jgi:hypothetical protein
MPGNKSSFVPNTTPKKTPDSPTQAEMPQARSDDKKRTEGATSITGQPLEGEALEKFKGLYEKSAMVRASYNPDGSLKADVEKITE